MGEASLLRPMISLEIVHLRHLTQWYGLFRLFRILHTHTHTQTHIHASAHVCSVTLVMLDSLRLYGLQPVRLLCPWESSGKNTGVGCHALLQGIFLTQGSKLVLLHCRQVIYHLSHQGSSQTSQIVNSVYFMGFNIRAHLKIFCTGAVLKQQLWLNRSTLSLSIHWLLLTVVSKIWLKYLKNYAAYDKLHY